MSHRLIFFQIIIMTFITLFFACLGFLSPANRGSLATTAIVLFVFLGCPAGYVSARLYKTFGGERWKCKKAKTIIICVIYIFSECYLDFIFGNGDSILHFLHYEFDIMGRTLIRRQKQASADRFGPCQNFAYKNDFSHSILNHGSYSIAVVWYNNPINILGSILWLQKTRNRTSSSNKYNSTNNSRTNILHKTTSRNSYGWYPSIWMHFHSIVLYHELDLESPGEDIQSFIPISPRFHRRFIPISTPFSPWFHFHLNPVFHPVFTSVLDLLHVWIYFPGLIDFDRYMFGNHDSTLLFPFGC